MMVHKREIAILNNKVIKKEIHNALNRVVEKEILVCRQHLSK